jgi:Zn-dependent M28 family amino/carboxypeptidase
MNQLVLLAFVSYLQAVQPATPPAEGILADVRALSSAATNEARFDAVTAMLRARSIPFTIEPFTIDKPVGREPRTEGRNIVVTLGQGTEEIVAGAHYDATRLADGSLSSGAIDNAASSVLLVRLAEALRAEKLARAVKVVWFDMEELGLLGSAQYVQRHAKEKIAAMLNLDVNGYGDTILYGPSGRPENAALRRKLVENCAAQNVECVAFAQMPPGDDRPFVKAGIPTVSIAILPALEVHQLWLVMNGGQNAGLAQDTVPAVLRTLHTAADAIDKIQEEAVVRMLRFTLALVTNLGR